MFGTQPYYNETIRKVVTAFGAIFNDVHIMMEDDANVKNRLFKVPLSYASKDKMMKFIHKEMSQDVQKAGQILPRMAFWVDSIEPDTGRSTTKNLKYKLVKDGSPYWVRRAPWKVNMSLLIVGRYEENVLQVAEQIYPEFQPSIGLTIKPIEGVDFTEDLNVKLLNMIPEREETDSETTRTISQTFSFSIPVWFYTGSASSTLIETAIVEYNVEIPITDPPTYEIAYTKNSVVGTYVEQSTGGSLPIVPSTLESGVAANAGRILVRRTASVTIGSFRVVMEQTDGTLKYPSLTTIGDDGKVIGITTTTVMAGSATNVVTFGEIQSSGWDFAPGPVYVGENGTLVQTQPTTGWVVKIGTALSSTRLNVDIDPISTTSELENISLNGGFF